MEIEDALAGYEIGILGMLKVKSATLNSHQFRSAIEFLFFSPSLQ